jgi:5-formyltetrahydrofolate cyclo-ligase
VTDGDSPDDPVRRAKAQWRQRLRAARSALPAAERAAAGAALTARLLDAAPLLGVRRVAAYVPVGTEPGAVALLDALRDRGVEVLLPVALPDRSLDWAGYDGRLMPAGHGLREPAGPRLGPAALAGVDVVLAPGLAVDRRGFRLGRGAGYYDRALAAVRAPVAVLLYDPELVEEDLPAEPHDRPVTAAVTPLLGWVNLS